MTAQITLYPVLFQVVLAIVLLFFWYKPQVQRWISIVGSFIALAISLILFIKVYNGGIHYHQAGNWPAPFGISFVADYLSATLVLLTSISGLAVSMYSAGSVTRARLRFGFLATLHFLLAGLNGAFLTGDIFNLYVWFEIIIISSFVLITVGGEKSQIEGAVKYFTLNILASVIFLTAIGILYGLAGTLNMADLSQHVQSLNNKGLARVAALMFFVGFGIKSAIFPLYFWLPASYHTPPAAVSAIFGGLLTKVGVYALLRVFTLIFTGDPFLQNLMLVLAILTLISGALGALVQKNVRKVFSYLIISHIGFMIAGLGLMSKVALAGAVFYLVHDIIVKTNLFMVSGLIFKITGSNNMDKASGIYAKYPLLALIMAIPLFSVVGIPPLSGFWPKLSLILASAQQGQYLLIAAMLLASFLTLFVIARIWAEVFWKDKSDFKPRKDLQTYRKMEPLKIKLIWVPILVLGLISLYIGFAAEHIQLLAEKVADSLLNPEMYIKTILGEKME